MPGVKATDSQTIAANQPKAKPKLWARSLADLKLQAKRPVTINEFRAAEPIVRPLLEQAALLHIKSPAKVTFEMMQTHFRHFLISQAAIKLEIARVRSAVGVKAPAPSKVRFGYPPKLRALIKREFESAISRGDKLINARRVLQALKRNGFEPSSDGVKGRLDILKREAGRRARGILVVDRVLGPKKPTPTARGEWMQFVKGVAAYDKAQNHPQRHKFV